jgi:predicted TIM-barrel fold metal-dependent hydrolase
MPIIDADVHHQYPNVDALAPYLPDHDAAKVFFPNAGIGNPRGGMRKDAVPPGGGVPGSDPRFMVEHHLDAYGVDYAILNPGSPLALGGLPFEDMAADVASATNDWTVHEWFPVDPRYLGSILVAPRDPQRAAAEIHRMASNPRMVQITMTSSPCLMGDRYMHPIYQAADEVGLPVCLHVGGADAGVNFGSYFGGAPSSFIQHHVGMCIPALAHVVSMVLEGVFEKFPNMHLILNEFGVTWLPFLMWRLDMEYRAGREDVPWLKRMPSEYIREFVHFTTQPLETPDRPKDIVTLLELVGAQDMLLYSSDYPHWDFDSPKYVLSGFPADWKPKIMFENSLKLFRLRERGLALGAFAAAV